MTEPLPPSKEEARKIMQRFDLACAMTGFSGEDKALGFRVLDSLVRHKLLDRAEVKKLEDRWGREAKPS